jgi:hybrid polyketide synthase/nonribosomal peptide synthetase ACE1
MRTIAGKFASYTFTDISSGFFEKAQEVFEGSASKMAFKILDIEKDISTQGFTPGAYDVIVASFVLHATRKLQETLKNVRRLMKPGGYLLLLEITNLRQSRLGFIFGSLPGWWLGADDGRRLTPLVTKPKWESLLRATGFSGIDTVTPDLDPLPFPVSALVSQAVDDKINFLRDPLYSYCETVSSNISERNLLIIGGTSSATARLTIHLRGLLTQHYRSLSSVSSIVEIVESIIPSSPSILLLEDLDRALFENLTPSLLVGLRTLFDKAENILWITREAHSNNPFHTMSTGFGRSMLMELPHVRTQYLDLDRIGKSAATEIAEALLRFEVHDPTESSENSDTFLWSTEPEVMVQSEKELIPRIMLNHNQNDRYNSFRRHITRRISMDDAVSVKLVPNGNSYVLSDHNLLPSAVDRTIRIQYSSMRAFRIGGEANYFVVLGDLEGSGERVVGLSTTNASLAQIPQCLISPCKSGTGKEFLHAVQKSLLALTIIQDIPNNGSLLVLEPDQGLAMALREHTVNKPISLQFLTTDPAVAGSHYTYIHKAASSSDIKRVILGRPTYFLCTGKVKGLEEKISYHLMRSCEIRSLDSLLSPNVNSCKPTTIDHVAGFFQLAAKFASSVPQGGKFNEPTLSLSNVLGRRVVTGDSSVVDWRLETAAALAIRPVDCHKMLKDNKTYWLVGLSRSLGISLCRWMIKHGARFIVISSRSPSIDKRLIQELESLGGNVKIYPW